MSFSWFAVCCALVATELATPWEQPYADEEATGPHVLGLWHFDAEDGGDASGRLPLGTLQQGRWAPAGKFGGCLESFPGYPADDRSHGFIVPHDPLLNPPGAFTVELWLKPKAELAQSPWSVLVDKKYAGQTGYQLSLVGPGEQQRLQLTLGFGEDSANFLAEPTSFPPDTWVHVAATYDGRGLVRFFRNGQSAGDATSPGRGAVAASDLPLSIGDRLGSNYSGLPGYVDEVRLSAGVREFGAVRIGVARARATYVRGEPPPAWEFSVTNLLRSPQHDLVCELRIPGLPATEQRLAELPAGATHVLTKAIDTSLRPDAYEAVFSVTSGAGEDARRVVETFPLTIVARPLPERMPVVMWGIGGVEEVLTELPRLKRLGFTHCIGGEIDHALIAQSAAPCLTAAPARVQAARAMLDVALAQDLRILGMISPTYFEPYVSDAWQLDANGQPYAPRSLSPNAPGLLELFERTGASVALTYGDHPGFVGLSVNSEVRDASQVSWAEYDRAAYRAEFGGEMPDWATSKYGVSYETLRDFPADRVVEDDDPRLQFYRWWWERGDGWNAAHTAEHRGLHAQGRPDLWTFYDPAVRVPPLWGSGGEVDFLSHWSYTDPEPLRVGLACDELAAMAAGRTPPAQTMKMIQLFWYRSTTAPAEVSPRAGESPAAWVDRDPSSSYISIHPLHLREALWTVLARPFSGLMFHGWSSLVPTDGSHAYKYTHPQLEHELTRLLADVVTPLGPTLRQVPAARSDVAFLQSFTSFVLAARGTWGYAGGSQADWHLALQYAHLQPEILYEQQLLRDGLDDYRLLFLLDCDVLPRSVVERIQAFQARGGLVVGDERLCPGVQADVVVPVFSRQGRAAEDKAKLLELAQLLRTALDGRYAWQTDSSNPEVVPRLRRAGEGAYLFLINDAREAGDYVGQYGLVQELGRPSRTEVRMSGPVAAVYDLVAQRPVRWERGEDSATISLELEPCGGRLLLATPAAIARVSVAGPAEVARGTPWQGTIQVLDERDGPIPAVVPVEVQVLDADGRPAEGTGYYGAAHGTLELTLDLAPNDRPGMWQVRVCELASRRQAVRYFRVTR